MMFGNLRPSLSIAAVSVAVAVLFAGILLMLAAPSPSGPGGATGNSVPAAAVGEAAALMTSGRNVVQYMGRTGTTYTGNLGGLTGANAKCNSAYSGSHMCTQSEFLRSGATSGDSSQGWIACTLYYTGFQGEVGPTFFWNECGNVTTETSYTTGVGTAGNCSQWLSTSGEGPVMTSANGSVATQACSQSRTIHCCK